MIRRRGFYRFLAGVSPALFCALAIGMPAQEVRAQSSERRPNLADVAEGHGWTLVNRAAEVRMTGDGTAVYLDARPGLGVAWLDGLDFTEGTITLTVQGRDEPQRSFVGVAFHGLDDETFDAVYFRPFNFLAGAEEARGHGVQYVSHPMNTWQRLRADYPGLYEAEVTPVPDPDGAFKVRIDVTAGAVQVFVDDSVTPCLSVLTLSSRAVGRIGLWVGNESDGLFSDLVITPRPR